METPSSAAKISPNSGNGGFSSSSKFVFLDICNDSPVVGLTVGTPGSSLKSISRLERKSCESESGEALLRRQVKSLLQSIDEESETEHPKRALCRSCDAISVLPVRFLAPSTPNNTPSSRAGNLNDTVCDVEVLEEVSHGGERR